MSHITAPDHPQHRQQPPPATATTLVTTTHHPPPATTKMPSSASLSAGALPAPNSADDVVAQVRRSLIDAAVLRAGIPHRHTESMRGYFRPMRYLGRGSFGSVELMYRCIGSGLWRGVAVKSIALYRFNSLGAALLLVRDAAQEVALSRRGRGSPHVLVVDEAWFDSGTNSVCLEMDAGDESLRTYAMDRHHCVLPPLFLLSICKQCAFALLHLHGVGVVHRDVKPSNFVVNLSRGNARPPLVRLTDFGLSCGIDDVNVGRANIGTAGFMATETLVEGGGADCPTARDVWSLGVTFHYVATGTHPIFESGHPSAPMVIFKTNVFGQPITPEATAVLQTVAWMLRNNYTARPSMRDVVRRLCSLSCTPEPLSPTALPALRRMRVCRPDARIPLYSEPHADDAHHTGVTLLGGCTLFALSQWCVPNPTPAPLPTCRSLPTISRSARQRRAVAERHPRRASSCQLVTRDVAPWFYVVYPFQAFVQPCVEGQHAMHFVMGDNDEETLQRCPPLTPAPHSPRSSSAERNESAALAWEQGNLLRAPSLGQSPAQSSAATLSFLFGT
jgi:serine/threonine protein kinase